MINKIEMYKVGFGDSFICSDLYDKNKMLVDFGSTHSISPKISSEVDRSLSTAQNKYLMITHFHSDHYGGLSNLNKGLNFAEIYLPNFLSKSIITLQFIALLANVAHGRVNDCYITAFNLLTSIPTLAQHFYSGTKVIFLNTSQTTHTNHLDTLRILWPDMNYVERRAKRLIKIITQQIDQNNGALFKLLNEYVNRFMNIMERNTDNGAVYLHARNRRDFESVFELIKESQQNLKINVPDDLLQCISSFQNRLCLCFDNASSNNDKPVLFLSDITPTGYRQMIQLNPLASYYSAIKVPHHGTRAYFIGNLPNSEKLLIPNDNNNVSWKIYGYFTTYSSRKIFINRPCWQVKGLSRYKCYGVPCYFCTHIL